MNTINKVTQLRVASNSLDETTIQTHFDEQNEDGWHLIGIDNLVGWYRFFWAKDVI